MHWTAGMESSVRKNAFACVLDIILKHHHKRVWLYVKHFRWVNSEECALHQQMFPGAAPMYAAKTNALFRPQIEDYIVQGECVSQLASLQMGHVINLVQPIILLMRMIYVIVSTPVRSCCLKYLSYVRDKTISTLHSQVMLKNEVYH